MHTHVHTLNDVISLHPAGAFLPFPPDLGATLTDWQGTMILPVHIDESGSDKPRPQVANLLSGSDG